MSCDRQVLRALALSDNTAWLRSFGCRVETRDDMILVHHDRLPEYAAWLFVERTVPALTRLERVVSGRTDGANLLYVDEDVANDDTAAILRGRIDRVGINVTVAAPLPRRAWPSSIELAPAKTFDAEAWSTIYSEGFGRRGAAAAIDRERWRLSFASSDVEHWFLIEHGVRVGVCQTTTGTLHGIYSFTLLPMARGTRRALGAVRAVLRRISRDQSSWIYFEVRSHGPQADPRLSLMPGLVNVRQLTGYELLHA